MGRIKIIYLAKLVLKVKIANLRFGLRLYVSILSLRKFKLSIIKARSRIELNTNGYVARVV